MDPIEIQETPDRDPIEIHIDVYKTVRVLCWDNLVFIAPNGAKCPYGVTECFADQPSRFWDCGLLAIV